MIFPQGVRFATLLGISCTLFAFDLLQLSTTQFCNTLEYTKADNQTTVYRRLITACNRDRFLHENTLTLTGHDHFGIAFFTLGPSVPFSDSETAKNGIWHVRCTAPSWILSKTAELAPDFYWLARRDTAGSCHWFWISSNYLPVRHYKLAHPGIFYWHWRYSDFFSLIFIFNISTTLQVTFSRIRTTDTGNCTEGSCRGISINSH